MHYIFYVYGCRRGSSQLHNRFFREMKCWKQPEWFVKWCVWVHLVYQGRVGHNGEQIRTMDPGASDWRRPFCADCWGILNNSGEMRSHDWAARVALSLFSDEPAPLCGEGRSEPGSGTQGVWESEELFWSCADVPTFCNVSYRCVDAPLLIFLTVPTLVLHF